ncbi:MAG: hypothetical protein ABIN91_08695 [Mucilaginibacter sp.]|uniref:hypothetical protein n=1 Tax=Mucilaginibacter sp. TaxID=1882438 RepID=UPI0032679E06
MKRLASTIIFILSGFSATAIDTSMVKLINKVIEVEIPSDYPYFYLINKGNTSSINENISADIKLADNKLKIQLVKEFVSNAKRDTFSIKWSDFGLPKARYVNKDHVGKKWAWAKITASFPSVNTETGEILPNTGHKPDPKALAETTCVSFSKPVFSTDRQYAFVATTRGMSGNHYLFKLTNGTWELISNIGWLE